MNALISLKMFIAHKNIFFSWQKNYYTIKIHYMKSEHIFQVLEREHYYQNTAAYVDTLFVDLFSQSLDQWENKKNVRGEEEEENWHGPK